MREWESGDGEKERYCRPDVHPPYVSQLATHVPASAVQGPGGGAAWGATLRARLQVFSGVVINVSLRQRECEYDGGEQRYCSRGPDLHPPCVSQLATHEPAPGAQGPAGGAASGKGGIQFVGGGLMKSFVEQREWESGDGEIRQDTAGGALRAPALCIAESHTRALPRRAKAVKWPCRVRGNERRAYM